jgi:hypothetical protein
MKMSGKRHAVARQSLASCAKRLAPLFHCFAAALGLAFAVPASARADELTMTCAPPGPENAAKEYVVHFNKQTRTLFLTRSGAAFNGRVLSVKETPDQLVVSGKIANSQSDFAATFYPSKAVQYFVSDIPTQQDKCH